MLDYLGTEVVLYVDSYYVDGGLFMVLYLKFDALGICSGAV